MQAYTNILFALSAAAAPTKILQKQPKQPKKLQKTNKKKYWKKQKKTEKCNADSIDIYKCLYVCVYVCALHVCVCMSM